MFLPLSCNFILPGDIFTQLSRMKCRMIADILPLSCHCGEGECPTRQSPGIRSNSAMRPGGWYQGIATALNGRRNDSGGCYPVAQILPLNRA